MLEIFSSIILNNRLIIFLILLVQTLEARSQLESNNWYVLYDQNNLKVEISFMISDQGCSNGYPTVFKYRYNGYLLNYEKFIDWKLDYINCNGEKYTYSSGTKIGGYNIQNELGKGKLEDLVKEEFDDIITSKKITSNLYSIETAYTKSFSNKKKSIQTLNGFHVINYEDGSKYEGNFKEDKFNGFGKYEFSEDGKKIKTVGDWDSGKFISGTVHINDVYVGEYVNGEFISHSSTTLSNQNKSNNKSKNWAKYNNDFVISVNFDGISPYNFKFSSNYADEGLGWYAGLKFYPNSQFPTNSGIYVVNNGIIEMWDGDYMDLGYFGPLKQSQYGNFFLNGGVSKMIKYPFWWSGGLGLGWERTIENRDHFFDSGAYWDNVWMKNKDLSGIRAYLETDIQLKIANRIVLKYGLLFNGNLNHQFGIGYAFI